MLHLIQLRFSTLNDHLNFSFVKDMKEMAEIWLEIVVKRQFVSLLFFVTPSTLPKFSDILTLSQSGGEGGR